MKPFTNPLPKPPPSARQLVFDPWNSSSTGHQRREAPRLETDGVSETGWRASRAHKINAQFRSASATTQPNVQPARQRSVMEMLVKPGSMKDNLPSSSSSSSFVVTTSSEPPPSSSTSGHAQHGGGRGSRDTQIFAGLVVHINGSTFPLVSDHKLKALLCEHGARVSLHLARRQVTHVILGRPAGSSSSSSSKSSAGTGCGGGLAGTKMDREIRRIGGCGIKYVGVEWVLESLKAGRRLPEARFSNLKIAAQRQSSVYSLSTSRPPS